jgi:hypothetical protein
MACRCAGECTCRFTRVDPNASTALRNLICAVDTARDFATQIGARTYEVALVWTRWTGGARGRGVEEITRREVLLPTPKIIDLSGVQVVMMTGGAIEKGSIIVSEVSARYSEDFLRGMDNNGASIPADTNFFYEVFFPRPGGVGTRRRFTLSDTPSYNPENLEWSLTLLRANDDPYRSGKLVR